MDTLTRYCRRRHVLPAVLCLLGWFVLAAPATGQLFLPLEVIGTGGIEGSPNLFTASSRFHPSYGVGEGGAYRIGASFALVYDPRFSLQGGFRAQARLGALRVQSFRAVEVSLAGEALWGTKNRNPVGGALVFSLNRVFQFTVRGGYDRDQEAKYFGASLGTDLSFWFKINKQPRSPVEIPIEFQGCAHTTYVEARGEALLRFDEEADLKDRTERFLEQSENAFRNLSSLAMAETFLKNQGLDALFDLIEVTINNEFVKVDCEGMQLDAEALLHVFVEAWKKALKL